MTGDCFEILTKKLLLSPFYRELPGFFLNKAFERISKESQSAILRRSAGIPNIIIAILRAEPDMLKLVHKQSNKKQQSLTQHGEPVLINTALLKLLEMTK